MKAIIVNSTFATKGGAKVILNQFIENCNEYYNGELPILIFAPSNFKEEVHNNIIIKNMNFKSWAKRLYWETIGLQSWLYREDIEPVLYISLQNNGLFFKRKIKNIRQIIYYHQSIPFDSNITWNLFKRSELKMWIYKYVYLLFVRASARKKKDIFIVQTDWIKNEMKRHILFKEFDIQIYKPDIPRTIFKEILVNEPKDKYVLFYPAFEYKYKNHNLFIDLVKEILMRKSKLCNKIKIIVTLDKSSEFFESVKKNSLESYFEFVGLLTSEEVYKMYCEVEALIFPSLLETFGLPLLEAAKTGLSILAVDKCYAREVLAGYAGVKFASSSNIGDWVNELENMVNVTKRYEYFIPRYDAGWKEFFKLIDKEAYNEIV